MEKTRRSFLKQMAAGTVSAAALPSFLLSSSRDSSSKNNAPNVLIIMADDCTYNDLPVYGGENAVTPAIDQLASEGLVFDQAYASSAMCQPCRASLYSGQYPVRNGCAYNHSASRPETRSLPHYLQPLGYRVGISGKVHVQPRKAYPFEHIEGFDGNCVNNPTRPHHLDKVSEFMQRSDDQPFCMVIGLVEPHVPWVMGDSSAYKPDEIKLPPNFADTEQTRENYSTYLAEITYMDNQVGEILQALEDSGKAENTLVLFTSEQGAQYPGCKWTNWNTGIHTGLIARWLGRVPAGKRTDALVQYVDIPPTLIELAGGNPDKDIRQLDGKSFADVLKSRSDEHRQFAYSIHNNIPEGPGYPVRSVTNGRYHYIRNLNPDDIFIVKYMMGFDGERKLCNQYWPTWVYASADNKKAYELVKRYLHRPAEQLYDTQEDPYELNNLAENPDYADIKAELSARLDKWMNQQGDPGAVMDTEKYYQSAREKKHLY